MALYPPPPPPPDYRTSDDVRTSISFAYSTLYNARGLEKIWYTPYSSMFSAMAESFSGDILVHPQHPLFIPSLVAAELNLRQEFLKHGLDFDDENTGLDLQDSPPAGWVSDVPPGVKAERVIIAKTLKAAVEKAEWKKYLKYLMERREVLYDTQLEEFVDGDPNTSSETMQSQRSGIGEEPDFVLGHVAKYELPLPDPRSSNEMLHYQHRAGIKIFHHCVALIAELKAPSSRFAKLYPHDLNTANYLEQAQEDLMEYCAAYFACNGDARSVIALAASGKNWRWAVITRVDTPEYDWESKQTLPASTAKVAKFHAKFVPELLPNSKEAWFVLGTERSDRQITIIRRDHIYTMIYQPGHTHLPVVNSVGTN